ncbi:MAG: hypothetical protein M3325_08300, partial [Actinomycetota bacterium]|nr:hypothetical protein [Actinomycetota bacterium]
LKRYLAREVYYLLNPRPRQARVGAPAPGGQALGLPAPACPRPVRGPRVKARPLGRPHSGAGLEAGQQRP